MTLDQFLSSPCSLMHNEMTWKEWFKDVLITLLRDGEGFSGKRPNCNSGWQEELADALSKIDPSIVKKRDEEGHPYSINWKKYNEMCEQVVEKLI